MIAAFTALTLLSVLWPAHGALTSISDLETGEEDAINEMFEEDALHCTVETNPETADSTLADMSLYNNAPIPQEFHAELFLGSPMPHEWACFQKVAAEAKSHMEYGTLGSYLEHKYPLFGDIGLNLKTFHVPHDNQSMALHWLKSVQLSQTERELTLSILLRPYLRYPEYDYASFWVYYPGIIPCMKSGPQSDEFAKFFQLTNSAYVGAIMASDNLTSLPSMMQFNATTSEWYTYFKMVPSTHCSNEEHLEMYVRNSEFIHRNLSEHQLRPPNYEVMNLIKHGHANIIRAQDPALLRLYLGEKALMRSYRLMIILINICDRPSEDYNAWMDLLWQCGISLMEYDTFFAPDRQSEGKNLLLEDDQGMRDGIILASPYLHQSHSDIPIWLWYKAMLADLIICNCNGCLFSDLLKAYRFAKVKKDNTAMGLFANRAFVCADWRISDPDIMEVPMDPVFMKGLLKHHHWDRYIEYCFAYAVVHNVAEIIELVLDKFEGQPIGFRCFCQEMLREGYIPEAYVGDFEKVAGPLMESVN